jgi:putative oxidoreductase
MTTTVAQPAPTSAPVAAPLAAAWRGLVGRLDRIPHSLIAFIARFSIAAVFWNSGQTKIEGLAINFVGGEFTLGWPRLADSALALFTDEYKLPFIAPAIAAPMAALAERLLPIVLLAGLATRLSALGLLMMTLVIQIFVYPGAYATHGTWAALLLYLMARGPGVLSVDHWLARCHVRRP